jgi:type IV secretory pathway VirB10-like protein
MFDQNRNRPSPDPDVPTPGDPAIPRQADGSTGADATGPADQAEGNDEHYDPTGAPEPLSGRGPAPRVKRFNRKTVYILATVAGVIVVLAFGTSLSRRPPYNQNEAAAQKVAAGTTTSDAINGLPNDYGQLKRPPQLGAPMPGDIGEIAHASGALNQAPHYPGVPQPAAQRQLTPLEQYEQQLALERIKRGDQARQGGFNFEGGGNRGGTGASNSELIEKALAQQNLAGRPGAGLVPVGEARNAARDDDNRQDDKSNFVNSERNNRWQLKLGQMKAPSPYTLFSGTIIPGVLITGINSDLPGQIKGQVAQNIYDTVTGHYLLLPQGSVLIGQYDSRVTFGQSRVLIVWTRIIRPDGSNIDLEGMPGADLTGYAGLTGDIDRHIWRLLGAVVLGSVIQAGAQSGGNLGYGSQTFGDTARQGLGSGVSDATQQMTRKELQLQPTITVAAGERFNVFLTKDVIMSPYNQ